MEGEEDIDPDETTADPPQRSGAGGVDYKSKFLNERRRHQLATTRNVELEDELAALRPKAQQGEQLSARIKDLEKQHAAERDGWLVERAAMGAGITDPEGVDVARLLHSKLPKEGRPPIETWLGGFKADPSKAPKVLQHYFPVVEEVEEEEEEEEEEEQVEEPPKGKNVKPAPKRPNSNGGVAGSQDAAGTGQQPSQEAIRAAAAKARMGDATEYNALMTQMGLRPYNSKR